MKNNSRLFTIPEQLKNIYKASQAFVLLRTSKKTKLMNKKFKERIMLAITDVNGCAMCSFVHTKLALSSGMSREHIQELLNGDTSKVPLEEAVGVLFGQHFADSREDPSSEAINRLIDEYGPQKAELVVAACHMITMTNAMGIGMDNFYHRVQFKKVKGSRLYRELFNPLFTMILFPVLTLFFFMRRPIIKIKLLTLNFE